MTQAKGLPCLLKSFEKEDETVPLRNLNAHRATRAPEKDK